MDVRCQLLQICINYREEDKDYFLGLKLKENERLALKPELFADMCAAICSTGTSCHKAVSFPTGGGHGT